MYTVSIKNTIFVFKKGRNILGYDVFWQMKDLNVMLSKPLSCNILMHPNSPLKAATCAGVWPSLSLILTSGVYCNSTLRQSLCPPTHTSCNGVRPVLVLDTGLWFCCKLVLVILTNLSNAKDRYSYGQNWNENKFNWLTLMIECYHSI